MNFPVGTVTFLFTDIEGSTKLWESSPEKMRLALARHDALLREAIESKNGSVFKTVGDAFCAAFATASDALAAALTGQLALSAEPWPESLVIRVRMALHTGEVESRDNDYFGPPLNRVARLLAIGYGGQTLLSQASYELVRDTLPEVAALRDMGPHRLKDLARPESVFQLLHPGLPGEFAPLRSLDSPELRHNLPQQVTSFIGREKELTEVAGLLSKNRLLTLTGSGGCGKTRLCLQVAAEVVEHYPEGVWLVELAALTDPSLVPQTIASVLAIREEPGRPIAQVLVEQLRRKSLLLVLDNCEHILSACVALADALLRSCPGVKLLASSRASLGIAGEHSYRVPSLALPDLRQPATWASLSQYEAVQLFVERAVAVQSTFTVTNASAPALAQLCSRLDGIPLAIELAAARVGLLSVEQINSRLHDRFRLLTGGSRAALPRQQTLRALMDWSYDLLSESERVLLRRLALFSGGWTLEAAEGVCVGEPLDEWEVLELLTGLADKSLVVVEPGGSTMRYRLLETVRQYAQERLQNSGQGEALRERHRSYFLGLAQEAEAYLGGNTQALWLERLEGEHDNFRAALEWKNDLATLRLCTALRRFWSVRGHLSEGRDSLIRALSGAESAGRTPERGKALRGAGVLAIAQGDFAEAKALLQESLAICQEQQDRAELAKVLNGLGVVAQNLHDYPQARAHYEEALAIDRELGNQQGIAYALLDLGSAALEQGDYEAAQTLMEESSALLGQIGDQWALSIALANRGILSYKKGNYDAAQALLEESVVRCRELSNRRGLAIALGHQGLLWLKRGDYASAYALLGQCLTINQEIGNKHGVVGTLEALADTLCLQGERVRAVHLWGATEAVRETTEDLSAPLGDTGLREEARTALGKRAFAVAWAEGRRLTLDAASALALQD